MGALGEGVKTRGALSTSSRLHRKGEEELSAPRHGSLDLARDKIGTSDQRSAFSYLPRMADGGVGPTRRRDSAVGGVGRRFSVLRGTSCPEDRRRGSM